MRRTLTIAFAFSAGLGAAAMGPATAAMMSASALLTQCDTSVEGCGGYIGGVIDQWGGFDVPANIEKMQKCMPEGVTMATLLATFTDYLTAHPDQLQSGANAVIVAALEETIAC